MARDRNTYAKRQRENEKRQKADAKRARRQKKKEIVVGDGDTRYVNPSATGQETDGLVGP